MPLMLYPFDDVGSLPFKVSDKYISNQNAYGFWEYTEYHANGTIVDTFSCAPDLGNAYDFHRDYWTTKLNSKEFAVTDRTTCMPGFKVELKNTGKFRPVRKFTSVNGISAYHTVMEEIQTRKIIKSKGVKSKTLRTNAFLTNLSEFVIYPYMTGFAVYRDAYYDGMLDEWMWDVLEVPGEEEIPNSGPVRRMYLSHLGNPISVNQQLIGEFGYIPSGLVSLTLPYQGDPYDLKIKYQSTIDACISQCERSLVRKVRNQKIDLASELAQMSQTVSMIADFAARLARFLVSLKNLNPRGAVSQLNAPIKDLLPLTKRKVANDYLVYQYGVSPLISDIQGAVEQLADYLMAAPPVFSRSRTKTNLQSIVPLSFLNWNGFVVTNAVVTVKYKIHFGFDADVVDLMGKLGFTNPTNVIWELVPFSFVVDWFLPIGDFLNNIGSMTGLRITEISRVIHIREDISCQLQTSAPDENISGSTDMRIDAPNSFGWVKANVKCYRETIPTILDMPLPTFKNPISPTHIGNAIALITQLFSGK